MIQGGDPNSKGDNAATYGTGGPGYTIKDELIPGNSNQRGTISMANAGPDTGGSQFFINLVENAGLNDKHPVFGEVVDGMGVVDDIAKVKTGARDIPVEPVVINDIEVKE
jgi:peptidylprolyl isomerase